MVRDYFYCVSPTATVLLVGFLSFDMNFSMDHHNDSGLTNPFSKIVAFTFIPWLGSLIFNSKCMVQLLYGYKIHFLQVVILCVFCSSIFVTLLKVYIGELLLLVLHPYSVSMSHPCKHYLATCDGHVHPFHYHHLCLIHFHLCFGESLQGTL